MITKWLRDSGLVVNESKTEVCLFHKNDPPKVSIKLLGSTIHSKKEMNVLGVTFDSKLTWTPHIANCINKAKKALFALRLIRKFFNQKEMRILLDANFYSVLYYNAVIWLTPEINSSMKQSLFSISANALKTCTWTNCSEISFENIHKLCKKSTPKQMTSYQASLNLHKILNEDDCTSEKVRILDRIVCTRRQLNFEIIKDNKGKIGMNSTVNKFYLINKEISLDALNLSFVHFKKLMKYQYLKYEKI